MAFGAELVADDQTELHRNGPQLIATCPAAIRGLIEARGVGLLRNPSRDGVAVALVADLGQHETERLPAHRVITILGVDVDLVLQPQKDHFPEALMLYLRHGRHA
jgi:HPr kinase/phosphorylase